MNKPRSVSPGESFVYYPGRGDDWERKKPEDVGMNGKMLDDAVDYTLRPEHETSSPIDLGSYLATIRGRNFHDDGRIIGPTKPRGGVNGLIIRHGYIVAEWGDTRRADMTFSVTKSYLSALFGLALDRGIIRDVHDLVKEYVDDGGFDGTNNAKITWHHFLQQTSEWVGTLWGKHHFAGTDSTEVRTPREPGTFYEYNDVRVNRFALALLRVWRNPLPQVLKENIMDHIDASTSWQWHGYTNSWVTIDGLRMQSVSGGGNWGGGMWIGSRDQARFGYLYLRRGKWKNHQLISEKWIDMTTRPSELNPLYGYMWWLNTNRLRIPSAPDSSYSALGAGGNQIFVDPVHDMVIVLRWMSLERFDGFLKQVLASMESTN